MERGKSHTPAAAKVEEAKDVKPADSASSENSAEKGIRYSDCKSQGKDEPRLPESGYHVSDVPRDVCSNELGTIMVVGYTEANQFSPSSNCEREQEEDDSSSTSSYHDANPSFLKDSTPDVSTKETAFSDWVVDNLNPVMEHSGEACNEATVGASVGNDSSSPIPKYHVSGVNGTGNVCAPIDRNPCLPASGNCVSDVISPDVDCSETLNIQIDSCPPGSRNHVSDVNSLEAVSVSVTKNSLSPLPGNQVYDESSVEPGSVPVVNDPCPSDLKETETVNAQVEFDVNETEALRQAEMSPQVLSNPAESDVLFPKPKNLKRHSWLVRTPQRFELGDSGYCYEGGIADQKMHGHGRLIMGDDKKFIVGNWNMNMLVALSSFQLKLDSGNDVVSIVQHRDDHLLTLYGEDLYVAKVTLESIETLDFAESVAGLRKRFFEKITVIKIVVDELKDRRQAALDKFKTLLMNMMTGNVDLFERVDIFILLKKCSEKEKGGLHDILRRKKIPEGLRRATIELIYCESRYLRNVSLFSKENDGLDVQKILSGIFTAGIEAYRKLLINKCPDLRNLKLLIKKLEESEIMYMTLEDVKVFEHLVSQPCFEHYTKFLNNLVGRFDQALRNIDAATHLNKVLPVMSPVYGFLVKSFFEIISEIVKAVDNVDICHFSDMLRWESGEWKLNDNIKWPIDKNTNYTYHQVQSLSQRSLESQYRIIFQMMNEFSPGNRISKKYNNFKVLQREFSWGGENQVNLVERLKVVPIERLVWLYIFDHTIHDVLKDDPEYQSVIENFNLLFQPLILIIEKKPEEGESIDSLRVLMHKLLEVFMSTVPISSISPARFKVALEILFAQVYRFSFGRIYDPYHSYSDSTFMYFIEEHNRYLSIKLTYLDVTSGYYSGKNIQMKQAIARIEKASLEKPVPMSVLLKYFKCLNDFLDDFQNLNFSAMWYVKSKLRHPENTAVEAVENKLYSGMNCSYRVTDVEKYVQDLRVHRCSIPKHYIIEVVCELLECFEMCLSKQWVAHGNVEVQHVAQLESTGMLLDAVRRSFMYLKEQPDYVDFEEFKKECVEPFVRLVSDCSTLSDLKKRSDIVKESFWFIRNMDAMGIDDALQMFKIVNDCPCPDVLRDCYTLYQSTYDDYITKYRYHLSDGKGHQKGLEAIIQMLGQPKSIHFSKWTEDFKIKKIPKILAGLSVIWSILVSKDVSSSGKILKPHCVQILCVMRLLSIDKLTGVDNHLAQVLTGQGKSLILGLLSSTLAVTGHKVRVMCYSKYLSVRDHNDFEEFFKIFNISGKIFYGTFEGMANSFLNPVCEGEPSSLRHLVKDRVLNGKWPKLGSVATESKDTVLLIDEVDVFFTDQFYGNSYQSCTTLGISGLDVLQEEIWRCVRKQCYGLEQIVQLSKDFLEQNISAGNPELLELKNFLEKPGTFPLLIVESDDVRVTQYTRQSLFDEHLRDMISDAVSVANSNSDNKLFRMNDGGVICAKRDDEIYSEKWFIRYLNTFNYFRLKGSYYDSKNFKNCGYLCLRTGQISYARLPSQFKHIVGVTGTLKSLEKNEMNILESYEINKFSYLPTFFGGSNREFEELKDFHYFKKQHKWLNKIYERACRMVHSQRAVLIFFENEDMMKLFAEEYKEIKIARWNELTENTDGSRRDKFIDESGHQGAVTLATRGMGRGVDYKSSMVVEKNGGVHVIQTFFSLDVKEEIQIRGRTRRKDNKGSYELIIFRGHLVRRNIIQPEDQNVYVYSSLDRIRQQKCDTKGREIADKILKCERNHVKTMKYFGLT